MMTSTNPKSHSTQRSTWRRAGTWSSSRRCSNMRRRVTGLLSATRSPPWTTVLMTQQTGRCHQSPTASPTRSIDCSTGDTATSIPPRITAPVRPPMACTTAPTREPPLPLRPPPPCWSQCCWTSGVDVQPAAWALAATICALPSGTALPGPPPPSMATPSSPARTLTTPILRSASTLPRNLFLMRCPLPTPATKLDHTKQAPMRSSHASIRLTPAATLTPVLTLTATPTPTHLRQSPSLVTARTRCSAAATMQPVGTATTWADPTDTTLSTATTGLASHTSSASPCPRSSRNAHQPAAATLTKRWSTVSFGWWKKLIRRTTRSAACRSAT
mmetsp:Transcript_7367/g.18269  ORF Transcript_7367/g.18269 Transcript_7367/m.18269 type:complete len:330 (-) Transcript_7367:934-1923(-)